MLRHIVMYKLREDCDKAKAIEKIRHALEPLAGVVPGLISMQIRPTLGGEYDYVLYSEFADRDSLEAYKSNPSHMAVKPIVHSYITERSGADTEV